MEHMAKNIGVDKSLPVTGGYLVPNRLSESGERPEDHLAKPDKASNYFRSCFDTYSGTTDTLK